VGCRDGGVMQLGAVVAAGRQHRGDARGADTVAARGEPTPRRGAGSRRRGGALGAASGEGRDGCHAAVRRNGREAGEAG